MAQVNTNNYKESLNYLNNSSIYEQNNAKINSVINYLDSRVLSVINGDLNSSKETFNNEIEAERTIKTTISTKIERYIEIESKAKERAGLITGTVAVAAGAAVAMAAAPVAVPIVGAVAGVTAVGMTKKDSSLQFFKDVGEGILNTGAKVVEGVKSITIKAFKGIGNFFKKAGNAVVALGEKTVSLCKNFISGAGEFIKSAAKVVNKFFSVVASSAGNLVMSLVEGVASFAEAIVDCAAMLGGAAVSLVITGPYDLGNWIGSKIFGTEFQSATKSMWTKGIMPFVGQDWTDKAFDAVYQTGFFKAMEENAIGPLKREGGTLYSIGKGIGYTGGLILATVATCGLAPAASTLAAASSTTVSTVLAGAGAMGKSSQKNYNKLSDEEKQNLGSIAKIVGLSAASGVVEAGAWYFTFGGGKTKFLDKNTGILATNKYVQGATKIWNNTASKLWDKTGGAIIDKTAGKLINKTAGMFFKNYNPLKATEMLKASNVSMAKMGIQFGKTYLTTGIDASATAANPAEVLDTMFSKKTFETATTNALVSLVYDNTRLSSYVKDKGKKVADRVTGTNVKPEAQPSVQQIAAQSTQQAQNMTQVDLLNETIEDTVTAQTAQENVVKLFNEELSDFCKDSVGKTVGGFIKKIMDVRKYPDILNEALGT